MGEKKPARGRATGVAYDREMTYARFVLAIAVLACVEVRAAGFDLAQFTLDAKASLVTNYKDPGTVQFRDVYVIRWEDKGREVYSLCGEINAKNSYGAYIGFVPFFVDQLPSGKLSASSELAHTIGNAAIAKFAVEHCTGKVRPVARVN